MTTSYVEPLSRDDAHEIPGYTWRHKTTASERGIYPLLRPLIFRLPPETAHNITLGLLRTAGALPPLCWALREAFAPSESGPQVQAFGLTFLNPVGLAAGYDKDGLGWRGLALMGFGHVEVGTVTRRVEPGNLRPRVFRLVEDQALINRMSFPNRGAEFVASRLKGTRPPGMVLGANIGKNKATPLEEAAGDYIALIHTFTPLVDYLTINVSSPNAPGLRRLQSRDALEGLLRQLDVARRREADRLGKRLPLLVKLAPDLTLQELDGALEAVLTTSMDGVIASNTTVQRGTLRSRQSGEAGGLSGAPLGKANTATVHHIVRHTNGRLPVVASGGIMQPADAQEKLDAGATLVQLYTGLIYAGPGLVKQILNRLARHSLP